MKPLHLLLIFASLLSLAFGQDDQEIEDGWIIRIENPPQNVTFNCSNFIQTLPNGSMPERWMFPDLTNVDLTYNDGRRIVQNNGNNLLIINANVEDFGLYHCMMLYPRVNEPGSEWYLVKVGLNVKGPYFEDTWEKYKQGTIVGVSACLGFLAISLLIWIVATHKWEPEPGWYDEEDKTTTTTTGGVDNNAFIMGVDSKNNLHVNYVPTVDKVDTTLHHRNNTKPATNGTSVVKEDIVAAASDMVTEL